jgi:HD-GYP domain-containing protein (c-di-GMP phosphodiesterase class II)
VIDARPGAAALIARLFGTLKLTQMFGPDHAATRSLLVSLRGAISDAAVHGETLLALRGQSLRINEERMRAVECGSLALSFLVTELSRRGIRSIRFRKETAESELASFARSFLDLDTSRPHACARLSAQMAGALIDDILVEAEDAADFVPTVMEDHRQGAMKTYLHGLRAFRDVLRCDGTTNAKTLRRARRAVQGIVDRLMEDENAVLALAQIRGFERKLFHHSLNVCLYSLAIGQRVGYARRALGDLGLAALFHDVGRTLAPDSKNAKDATTDHAGPESDGHTERGALFLLRDATGQEGMLKAAIAAYEHHSPIDCDEMGPHLSSRIVAVADCYDSLTADGGCSSQDALDKMQSEAGRRFDPLLLKVLAGALGAFPVGSLVELVDGTFAVVIEAGDAPDRPKVRIVDPVELPRGGGAIVDLDDRESSSPILRAVTPSDVFDSLEHFVAAT